MTIKPVILAELQQSMAIVDAQGRPTPVFLRFINGTIQALKNGVNDLIAVQNAADAANAAAVAANDAAAAAQTAADGAQDAADGAADATVANAREQALINSYIEPVSVLTTTTTTISVAAHTRFYADGTSVSVNAGTVAATGSGDTDYVSYSDPTRAGGAVTYIVALSQPPQTADVHVIGAILIPSVGTANGGVGPKKPGYVTL